MEKYKVVIVSTGAVKGTDLTKEQAEKLAEQVRRYTGLSVAVEEVK